MYEGKAVLLVIIHGAHLGIAGAETVRDIYCLDNAPTKTL